MTKKLSKKIIDKFSSDKYILDKAFIPLLIFFFLYILFIGSIVYYIRQVKNCQCFNELNKNNDINITYIYVIEIILLVLSILSFISTLYLYINVRSSLRGGYKNIVYINIFAIILGVLIQFYLLYNIYKFIQLPDDNCDCMKSWIKKLLYIQIIIIVIYFVYNVSRIFRSVNERK